MNPLFIAILLSLLPVSELRGGIPYAITNGVNVVSAFISCVLANIAIVPLIFFFLDNIHNKLLKYDFYKKNFDSFLKRLRKRKKKVEKAYESYGILALTIFVAIPLPFTGAWTGTIIAWLLNLKRTKSFFAIFLGILIAGTIVTLIATGILALSFLL